MCILRASIMKTFSITEASMTEVGKDTKTARSQKKYLSSTGKMTWFNMSRMIKKESLLDSVTQVIVHLALIWILNICLKKWFHINFCFFWKVPMCNLLIASLKKKISDDVWLMFLMMEKTRKTATSEGMCMVSECQDGTDTLSRVKQDKSFIYLFKR